MIFIIMLSVLKEYVSRPVIVVVALGLIWGNSLYYIDSTIHTEKVLSENETEREASIDGLYLYNDFSTIENLNDWSLCTMLCCIAVGAKNMWGRWKHVL